MIRRMLVLVLLALACDSTTKPDDGPAFGEIQARDAIALFAGIGPLYHTAFGHTLPDGRMLNPVNTTSQDHECTRGSRGFGVWSNLRRTPDGYGTETYMPGLQTLTIHETLGGGTTIRWETLDARPCRFSPGFVLLVPWEALEDGSGRSTVHHEVVYRDGSDEWRGRWTGYFFWQQEHTKEDGRCEIDLSGSGTVKRFVTGDEPGASVRYRGKVCDQDIEIEIDVTAGRRSNCFELVRTEVDGHTSWRPSTMSTELNCVRS